MAKYSKDIVKRITDLISQDSYTIAEICQLVGIAKSTYFEWEATKPDFSDSIKKAKEEFNEMAVVEAKKSLMKKIRGYDVEEVKTVMIPTKDDEKKPKVKEKTVTKKHVAADTTSIIFLLTNLAQDEFKHRQSTEAKVSINKRIEDLSEDELNQVIDNVVTSRHQ